MSFLVLDIKRSLLDFVVDASDVFAEDADRNELHSREKYDGGHERCPAGNCCRGGKNLFEDGPDEYAETYDGSEKSQVETELERRGTETGDTVKGEAYHFLERVLGGACCAFSSVVLDADFLEADPADEPAQESAAFRQVLELVYHAAVHEAEVAGIGRNVDARELADETVEAVCGKALEDGFALALVPLGINHLVAFAPFFKHLVNQTRRVLKVPVDNDDGIADTMVEACAECRLVPEVTAEVDNLVVRVARQ